MGARIKDFDADGREDELTELLRKQTLSLQKACNKNAMELHEKDFPPQIAMSEFIDVAISLVIASTKSKEDAIGIIHHIMEERMEKFENIQEEVRKQQQEVKYSRFSFKNDGLGNN